MKDRLIPALIAGSVLAIFALPQVFNAQVPPLPPGMSITPGAPITNTVRVAWDRNPATDYLQAVDTNGIPVPLVYRVRMSTNLAAPFTSWPVLATTTNTSVRLTNLVAANMFFGVTASNFFLESEPSPVVAIPWDPPTSLRLIVE